MNPISIEAIAAKFPHYELEILKTTIPNDEQKRITREYSQKHTANLVLEPCWVIRLISGPMLVRAVTGPSFYEAAKKLYEAA